MEQSKQYRLGNLVLWDNDKVYEITELSYDTLSLAYNEKYPEYHPENIPFSKIKPIPLTDEWLVGFGFDKEQEGYCRNIMLYSNGENGYNYNASFFEHDNLIAVEYVHNLQNLYYALNNEELIIAK